MIHALDSCWFRHHGGCKELICDGEGAIAASEQTQAFLVRKGVKFVTRAPGQHAQYVERRGALLRDVLHRVEGQLKDEGIPELPFEVVLSEAVSCGNALLSLNGSTPYNAVYGRVPLVLPGIDSLDPPDDSRLGRPGTIACS